MLGIEDGFQRLDTFTHFTCVLGQLLQTLQFILRQFRPTILPLCVMQPAPDRRDKQQKQPQG